MSASASRYARALADVVLSHKVDSALIAHDLESFAEINDSARAEVSHLQRNCGNEPSKIRKEQCP